MNQKIHPTAIIEPGATLYPNVTVEAYAFVGKHVVLHEGVTIRSHAYIEGFTTIQENTTIYPFACIGLKTQDLKFRGEKTFVNIGKNTEIREFVTINSSCGENTEVRIGDRCLIMAYCHVAHNCIVGNDVIMSNNATLAGHVEVADKAIIGGFTPIHQFVRVGTHAMVGGMSRVTHDIPPFTLGGGIPYKFGGINLVGLKRNKFDLKTRKALAQAYKILYRSGLRADEALAKIEREIEPFPEVLHFVEFCKNSKRGLMILESGSSEEEVSEEEEAAIEERSQTLA